MPKLDQPVGRFPVHRSPAARRWRMGAIVLALLVAVVAPQTALGAKPPSPNPPSSRRHPPTRTLHVNPACTHPYQAQAVADDLMANRYTFENEPTVTLPPPEEWDWTDWPDPVRNTANWRFQFHALVWVLALVDAWENTGQERYRDRALFAVRSWVEHNPIEAPASTFAWHRHGTALRAMSLVCVARAFPGETWLQPVLLLHGQTLRDPDFYMGVSNGAVNQSVGLLEIGCLINRPRWQEVAQNRLNGLIRVSVDDQGVANEPSIWYQWYNYERYSIARDRLTDCGRIVAPEFVRINRMPRFLGFATTPAARYEMIGDTMDRAAKVIPGTIAEFAATQGARGPKPKSTIARFDAGYVFGRTGWGDTRAYGNEISFSLRYGPPDYYHGHFDASSLTVYGYGSRLLLDPGFYGYEEGVWRGFFRSPTAHNVVTSGTATRRGKESELLRSHSDQYVYEAVVTNPQLHGVTSTRRFVFSRTGGYMLVEDNVASSVSRDWAQLWHLREGTRPVVDGERAWTRRDERGNVMIQQLLEGSQTRVVRGKEKPRQGWLTYEYATLTPAPTLEYHQTGETARYITLIVPFAKGNPPVVVKDVVITDEGFEATIRVLNVKERVVATADGTTITPIE